MGVPTAVALGSKSAVGVIVGVAVASVVGVMVGVVVGANIVANTVAVAATVVTSSGGVGGANAASPAAINLLTVSTAICGAAPWRSAQRVANC